jgi:hypothetical protein
LGMRSLDSAHSRVSGSRIYGLANR